MPFLQITELGDVVLCQMVAINPPSKNQSTPEEGDSFGKSYLEESIPSLFDVAAPYLVRP